MCLSSLISHGFFPSIVLQEDPDSWPPSGVMNQGEDGDVTIPAEENQALWQSLRLSLAALGTCRRQLSYPCIFGTILPLYYGSYNSRILKMEEPFTKATKHASECKDFSRTGERVLASSFALRPASCPSGLSLEKGAEEKHPRCRSCWPGITRNSRVPRPGFQSWKENYSPSTQEILNLSS